MQANWNTLLFSSTFIHYQINIRIWQLKEDNLKYPDNRKIELFPHLLQLRTFKGIFASPPYPSCQKPFIDVNKIVGDFLQHCAVIS